MLIDDQDCLREWLVKELTPMYAFAMHVTMLPPILIFT